jgi:hypothetical protein
MRIRGEADRLVHCTARAVLETVLQPELYALADHKIGDVLASERQGDRGMVRARGRLGFIQTPALTLHYVLSRYDSLELSTGPRFWGQFRASFACEETAKGTHVRHVEELALRWLACLPGQRLLGRLFSLSVAREVARLKLLLEGAHSQSWAHEDTARGTCSACTGAGGAHERCTGI